MSARVSTSAPQSGHVAGSGSGSRTSTANCVIQPGHSPATVSRPPGRRANRPGGSRRLLGRSVPFSSRFAVRPGACNGGPLLLDSNPFEPDYLHARVIRRPQHRLQTDLDGSRGTRPPPASAWRSIASCQPSAGRRPSRSSLPAVETWRPPHDSTYLFQTSGKHEPNGPAAGWRLVCFMGASRRARRRTPAPSPAAPPATRSASTR